MLQSGGDDSSGSADARYGRTLKMSFNQYRAGDATESPPILSVHQVKFDLSPDLITYSTLIKGLHLRVGQRSSLSQRRDLFVTLRSNAKYRVVL